MVNETVGGLRSNASAALKFRIMACLQGAGVCRIYSNFFPATGSRRILTTKKGKEVGRGVIKTRFPPDMERNWARGQTGPRHATRGDVE